MQVYIQLPKRFFKILFLFSFYRHKVLKFYYWLASLISLENLSKLTSLDIYITMVLLNRPIFELTWSHLSSFFDVWNSWLIRGQRFKGNLAFADPSVLRFPLWQSQPTLQVKYISYEKFLRRRLTRTLKSLTQLDKVIKDIVFSWWVSSCKKALLLLKVFEHLIVVTIGL